MSSGTLQPIDVRVYGGIIRRMPLGPNSDRIQAVVTKKEKEAFLKLCDRRRQSESSLAAMIIADWMKANKK